MQSEPNTTNVHDVYLIHQLHNSLYDIEAGKSV